MKIKTTLSALVAALAIIFATTSCNNGNDEQELKMKQTITRAFVKVSDNGNNESISYQGVSYTIIYDYIALTSEVTIQGLKLPDGTQYPALTLNNVPFKVTDDGWCKVEGSNLQSEINGFANAPLFNSFKLNIFNRTINQYYYPLADISYSFDSRYSVVSSTPDQIFTGTTTVIDQTETDPAKAVFTSTDPVYTMVLNFEKMTGDISINGAKFSSSMPALNMKFSGIPFTISNNGFVTLESSNTIIPTIGDTPYKQFPISDFKAVLNLSERMDIGFTCNAMGKEYKVAASLPFVEKKQSESN